MRKKNDRWTVMEVDREQKMGQKIGWDAQHAGGWGDAGESDITVRTCI
jgi:hypothetical protein